MSEGEGAVTSRAFAFVRPGPAGLELCLVRPEAAELERLIVRELGEHQALELARRLLAGVAGEQPTHAAIDTPGVRRDGADGLELVLYAPGLVRVTLSERRALELACDLLARVCAQLAARNAAKPGGDGLPWGASGD